MYEAAAVEHIAELFVLRCGGCGDIAVLLAQDGAVFEPAGGGAEDKVCSTFDPAVPEVLSLALAICIYGVLVGLETAVYEGDPVAVHRDCAGLAYFLALSGRVPDRKVFCKEV